MAFTKVLLLCGFLAAASAVPWPRSVPICAEECPVNEMSKLKYMTDKTYVYSYTGKSKIELKGVDGGVTETDWQKKVLLSWLSPCEMAITFEDVHVDGAAPSDHSAANFLTKYPLVVALTDGRVQQVCSHPHDDPWAINMKKGVATAFQNLLPSLSPLNSGVNFTETDTLGRCPTKYEVEREGDKVVIRKDKNHRLCLDRYPTPSGIPKAWLKAPAPIEESWSTCKQEIQNGIYSSITCKDMNVIRPSPGAYKHIEGTQVSTLKYLSESEEAPESLSTIHGEYDYASLLYDHRPLRKEQSAIALLDAKLFEICEKTKENIELDTASRVAELIEILKRVPDDAVSQTLPKIRAGRICPQKKRIESVFLDAIGHTYESGSVEIMVDELLKGDDASGRKALYASALYHTYHPNPQAVGSLIRLFQSEKRLSYVLLSAGSLVNNFCKHYPDCHRVRQVQEIIDALNSRVQQQCIPCNDTPTKYAAIATLEVLGNIGVMTPEVSKSILKCIETKGVETNIRVAGIRAFRNAKCQRYATMNFANIAVDPKSDTEIRIGSYLAVMRCAEMSDLREIFSKISKEENTQVRAFVMSHFSNIQKSSNPEKKHLRYMLNEFVIPSNYTNDFRKRSSNIDLTFHSPTLGLGGGVESNIIYGPGSFVPRSMIFNATADLYGQSFNFGEIGSRFEGLDDILTTFFGPDAIIHKSSLDDIVKMIGNIIKEKGGSVLEQVQTHIRQRRSIDATAVTAMLKKIYEEGLSNVPRAELYANVMGQDIFYSIFEGNLKDIDLANVFNGYISKFKEGFAELRDINQAFFHTSHMSMDYHLPTVQGTPLRFRFDGTAVFGMKMEGKLDMWQMFSNPGNTKNSLKMNPSFSVEANGFIGYDCFLSKTGIQMNNSISSNSGMSLSIETAGGIQAEVHIDIPENMELLHFESETYLMKMVRGSPEHVIIPSSVHDVRFKQESCISELEPMLGFRVCYGVDVPDIFKATGLPLGARSIVKFHIDRTDPSLKGYTIKAALQNGHGHSEVTVNMETKGLSTPRKTEAILSYTKDRDTYQIKATVVGPSIKSGLWVTMKNQVNEKDLEIFAEYKSSARTISQGFKIESKSASSSSGGYSEIAAFASQTRGFPSTSKIISISILSRKQYDHLSYGFIVKTHNAMRNIVALTFETAFDLQTPKNQRIPLPTRLRRMELHLDSAGWQITSYLRQTDETQALGTCSSAFKISHRSNEILAYDGTHTFQGTTETDFVMMNKMNFKFGTSAYKVDQQILYGFKKTGMLLKIFPQAGTTHYLDLEATFANSDQEHKILFLVDIPAMTSPMKLIGRLRPRGDVGTYQLQISLDHGDRKALEIAGPAIIILSPTQHKIHTDLQVKVLGREPYKVSTKLEFSHEEILLFFEAATQRDSLFLIEWKVGPKSLQETHMAFRLDLISFLRHRLEVIAKPNLIEVLADAVVLPRSPHERRVKCNLDVPYTEKKMKLDFAWDADRNPGMKVVIDSQLVTTSSQPGHYSIISTVNHAGKVYNTRLNIDADFLIHPDHGQNGFKFTLTNPERKTVVLEMGWKIERDGTHAKIDSLISYKNQEDLEYKFTNLMDVKPLGEMGNFQIDSEVRFKRPELGESSVRMMAKSNTDASSKRNIVIQMTVAVTGVHPMVVEFSTVTRPDLCTGELKVKSPTPSKLFAWKTELHARGRGIKTFEVSMDFTGVANILKMIRQMIVSGGASSPAISTYEDTGRRAHYQCRYDNPTPNRHTIWMQTPTRRMEMESEISPRTLSLSFYPDKERSDAKYEVNLHASITEGSWDSSDKYEWRGRVSHPSLIRDRTVTVEVSRKGAGLQGTIEIDLLPDSADKMTGTITSSVITQDTVKMEASLSARIFKVNPKLTITFANAPNTIGFDVAFQGNPSSPILFMIVGKYDHSSERNRAVSFEMKSGGESVMALSVVTKPQREAECYGMQAKASVVTSVTGRYDIQTKLCRPMYMKFSINKHNSLKVYTAAFGLQDPSRAEVSLTVEDRSLFVTRKAFLAQVMLISSTMVNLDFDYEATEMTTMLNYLRDNGRKIFSSVESWVQMIKTVLQEAARSQSIEFPSADFMREWQIIQQEADTIFRDLLDNKIYPAYIKFRHFLHSPAISYITDVYSSVWSKMADLHRDFRVGLTWKLVDVMEVFSDAFAPVAQAMRELAHMMKTAQVPEFIQTLRRKFEESWLYQSVQRELNDFGNRHPMQYQAFLQVWSKLRGALLEDLEKLRLKFMTIPPVVDLVNWITNRLKLDYVANIEAEKVVSRFLQETIFVSVTKEPSHVGIQIPLREPLQSLHQVLREDILLYPSTILKNVIWWYDTYITLPIQRLILIEHSISTLHTKDHIPPFNGTALVVGNTEILTFDGTQFRIPKTACRIQLATYSKTSLTFEHKQKDPRPTIILTHNNIKATVNSDFTVYLNGQKVTDHADMMGIAVKITLSDVFVRTPLIAVHIPKEVRAIEIEATGWILGEVAGVLGTFDGERDNDWLMPSGVIATDVQQFVTSWQEDHNCRTPSLKPAHVPMSRMVECHALVGMRSRCNPIVNPHPFIRMCHETQNPCDAAKAYRHVCKMNGVLEPYPQPC